MNKIQYYTEFCIDLLSKSDQSYISLHPIHIRKGVKIWYDNALSADAAFRESISRTNKHLKELVSHDQFKTIEEILTTYPQTRLLEFPIEDITVPVSESDIKNIFLTEFGRENESLTHKLFTSTKKIFAIIKEFFSYTHIVLKDLNTLSEKEELELFLQQFDWNSLENPSQALKDHSKTYLIRLEEIRGVQGNLINQKQVAKEIEPEPAEHKINQERGWQEQRTVYNDSEHYKFLPLSNEQLADVIDMVNIRESEFDKLDATVHMKRDLLTKYFSLPTKKEPTAIIQHSSSRFRTKMIHQASNDELIYHTELKSEFETTIRLKIERKLSHKRHNHSDYFNLVQKWSAVLYTIKKRLVEFEFNLLKFIETVIESEEAIYKRFSQFYKKIATSIDSPDEFLQKFKLGMGVIKETYPLQLQKASEIVTKKYRLFSVT